MPCAHCCALRVAAFYTLLQASHADALCTLLRSTGRRVLHAATGFTRRCLVHTVALYGSPRSTRCYRLHTPMPCAHCCALRVAAFYTLLQASHADALCTLLRS